MTATTPVGGGGAACGPQGRSWGLMRKVLHQLKWLVSWPVRVGQARRSFAPLARMTDYELRDIGLTRQDLWNAASLPLDEDPTRYLARTAAEGFRNRRGIHE
jgi:uncharacterized protein YjiS (DUF1127 family)